MPAVSVNFDFWTKGGKHTIDKHKIDTAPHHDDKHPGMPLEPTFGFNFPIETNESGKLFIGLIMDDTTVTGEKPQYIDAINFDVQPCK